ncbi:MAG: hypothetical protein RLY71_4296 [Pseudomonadota bacterium]|jgi:hypothetical protein
MLRRTMDAILPPTLQLQLDDVLGNLRYARRTDDLGRLALLTYCEVRRWARCAHQDSLAEQACELVARTPHRSRSEFLSLVDEVISELEQIRSSTH